MLVSSFRLCIYLNRFSTSSTLPCWLGVLFSFTRQVILSFSDFETSTSTQTVLVSRTFTILHLQTYSGRVLLSNLTEPS
jgi:hypothetical protein